jgi:dCTP diphosphatase
LSNLNVNGLIENLRTFASDREWDQFHTPKNLSMALSVEAAELLEQFQWLTEAESLEIKNPSFDPGKREAIGEEIADVLLYTFRLADILNIDLESVTEDKLLKNAKKYPIGKSKGLATKYNKLK